MTKAKFEGEMIDRLANAEGITWSNVFPSEATAIPGPSLKILCSTVVCHGSNHNPFHVSDAKDRESL